jgi:hypothetical protein
MISKRCIERERERERYVLENLWYHVYESTHLLTRVDFEATKSFIFINACELLSIHKSSH